MHLMLIVFFTGVSGLSVKTSKKIAGRAATYFVSTTVVSVTIGKKSGQLFLQALQGNFFFFLNP